MAQSHNGAATSEDLERQIEALKNDIAGISRTLTDMGAARGDEVKARVHQTASDLQDRGRDMGEQAADAVRRQPATAVGIAVGLGFVVGLLTGRR